MKSRSSIWSAGAIPLCLFLLLGFVSHSQAQGPIIMPVVSIYATAPHASWSGDPGQFTVVRQGPTNATLNVFYRISGTATNGIDYTALGNWVQIPAGERTSTIKVSPIDKGQTDTRTVVLTLAMSPLMPPVNYMIGFPSNATVLIAPQPLGNFFFGFRSPTNGQVFNHPPSIQLEAAVVAEPATTNVPQITSVEFFADNTSLGATTNWFSPPESIPGTTVFALTWTNPAPGSHVLLAEGRTDNGASIIAKPVSIFVGTGTNVPPVVYISTPMDGSVFFTPANVPICANAFDLDGYVATVEFFERTNSLGVTTNNPYSGGPRNSFCLVWSNAPVGDYELRARATDNGGATTLSDPVNISVVTGPPPPPPTTNYPPVVRIASPPNGALFPAPATIPIYAYARDPDDAIAAVEFFDGTTSLGFGSNICAVGPRPVLMCPTNLFVLVWSNAPVGVHPLSAKATDVRGAAGISEAVLVTVVAPPPPPTNRPPIISILAVDPIAIEGTNCWPWLGLTNPVPSWSNWAGVPVRCRWFTNCGPKNATFIVRRLGATNDDVTVSYAIGGTATNGVDYVPLSGSVTIPAGERRASISIVPIDDGPPDRSSTVVLRLQPSPKLPADYLLGYPRAAAALIVDGLWPGRGPRLLSDGSFLLNATGPDGAWFHVEYSTDLVSWIPICTNQVVNGFIDFVDPDAPTSDSRFYRAVPELTPSFP